MRSTRPLHVVTLAAGATLLAACGGAPEASPAPTPSGSTTPSASLNSEVPAIPTEAQQKTDAGAAAFAEYYVSVLNAAGPANKAAWLEPLATRDCVRCAALVSGIRSIYADGGRIVGGGWTVNDSRTYGEREGRYFVDLVIDSAPQTVVSRDGSRQEFPGATDRLRSFVLQRVGPSWRVAEIDPTA